MIAVRREGSRRAQVYGTEFSKTGWKQVGFKQVKAEVCIRITLPMWCPRHSRITAYFFAVFVRLALGSNHAALWWRGVCAFWSSIIHIMLFPHPALPHGAVYVVLTLVRCLGAGQGCRSQELGRARAAPRHQVFGGCHVRSLPTPPPQCVLGRGFVLCICTGARLYQRLRARAHTQEHLNHVDTKLSLGPAPGFFTANSHRRSKFAQKHYIFTG